MQSTIADLEGIHFVQNPQKQVLFKLILVLTYSYSFLFKFYFNKILNSTILSRQIQLLAFGMLFQKLP